MKSFSHRAATLFAAAALLTVGAAPGLAPVAHAQSAAAKAAVDQAKAAGIVGEQADGFLGVVSGADTAVRAAVAEINAGRAEAYREAAAKTGVSAEAAGQATARQLQARTPAGQYIRTAAGQWERK